MYEPLAFIVHRTAGHTNVQQLYDYWQSTCISSHFGISYDGHGYDPLDIWQYVELWDGSGANCCPESGTSPFFANRGGNANVYTISVEVCTPNTNNQGLMTAKQEEALIYLIRWTCEQLGIPAQHYTEWWNDYETSHDWIHPWDGGIGMHRCVSPHNKRMCPGDPYYQGQMDRIIAAVRSGTIPSGGNEYVDNIHDKEGWLKRRWEAFYQRCNQTFGGNASIPRMNTGICEAWKEQMLKGNDLGAVMSEEWQFDDKMFQDFTASQGYYDLITHDIRFTWPQ